MNDGKGTTNLGTIVAAIIIAIIGPLVVYAGIRLINEAIPTRDGSSFSPTQPAAIQTALPAGNSSGDEPSSGTANNYCYGNCWLYDDNARTMTWTGATDGIEDIWQPSGEALQKIRGGYTAILSTAVPGEIFACVLTVNGSPVKETCDGVLYQVSPGEYRVTSADRDVGGFRWCPAIGYGWRANGGTCR